jgi:hypothetical protein
MQAFIIESANKPGELARQAAVIADRDINVYPFSLGLGSRGGCAFLAADEEGVKSALTGAGIKYHEVPVLAITLEDKPGTTATVARKLGDAGVNIELYTPVPTTDGTDTILIGVDKLADAKRVLSNQLTEWSVPERIPAGMSSRL